MDTKAFIVVVALLSLAAPAAAQDEEAPQMSVEDAAALLSAESPSEVQAGLETLGLSGAPAGVAPIMARIERGLPPELLSMAIDTLSILGRPEAGPVLVRLTRHRRADVRLSAVRAVAAVRAEGAEQTLVASLSDSAPEVRGASAEALGSIEARGSLDALFQAMEHQVPEAPMAIGQLAGPQEIGRFLGYLGGVSLDTLGPALSEMLHRGDLPDSARVSIVHRISEFATPGAGRILQDFVNSSTESEGGAARLAAIEAMPRMGQ